jgi:hypothetical protein
MNHSAAFSKMQIEIGWQTCWYNFAIVAKIHRPPCPALHR